MRLKNDSVNIANLKTILRKRIAFLDLLHKEFTGKELVITSGNDGKHMKTSKHYSNKAIDFRRWEYDKLSSANKSTFLQRTFKIFPTEFARQQDAIVKSHLIGSKITDIRIEPIKNRKTMRTLIIETDAGRVEAGTNAYLDLSEIRVRIKSKS